MIDFEVTSIDYERYSNRQLVAVPLAIFTVAMLILAGWTVSTGAPVNPSIEFVGGTEIRIADEAGLSESDIESAFVSQPETIQSIPSENAYILTFNSGGPSAKALEDQAKTAGFDVRSSSEVSASFGSDAQRLAIFGVLGAFTGMSAIIFFLFRTFVPSIAVVASAASDIIVPMAVMNLFSIKLSLGAVAALLMLIGYSVDSDILLNDYVLRRRGSFYDSVYEAMETGVSMTLTSLIAMAIMTVSAFILGVPMLRDIGFILVVGLSVDLINTYMMNFSLLRWYKFEGVKA